MIAVTFKCVPLFRVTEATFLVPSRDNILESSLYISGLGLVAVVIAVTFKCVPLFRVTEVTYLSSIREKKNGG